VDKKIVTADNNKKVYCETARADLGICERRGCFWGYLCPPVERAFIGRGHGEGVRKMV